MLNCPYCNAKAELVNGAVIYPHRPDLFTKLFYHCAPCDSYVGCHPGTDKPLGRLANAQLRAAKSAAHRAFDPIWQGGRMPRKAAYAELAATLGIPVKECHIGMFDLAMCKRVIVICTDKQGLPC